MAKATRVSFDVTAEQAAELAWLREALGSRTTKDAVLHAVRVAGVLCRERGRGALLYLHLADGEHQRLVLPELESPNPVWRWLVTRAHPWRRQKWIKGRRTLASTVWRDMLANEMTEADVAEQWDLPLEAVDEVVAWCGANAALIAAEALEERRWLQDRGVRLEPAGLPDGEATTAR